MKINVYDIKFIKKKILSMNDSIEKDPLYSKDYSKSLLPGNLVQKLNIKNNTSTSMDT